MENNNLDQFLKDSFSGFEAESSSQWEFINKEVSRILLMRKMRRGIIIMSGLLVTVIMTYVLWPTPDAGKGALNNERNNIVVQNEVAGTSVTPASVKENQNQAGKNSPVINEHQKQVSQAVNAEAGNKPAIGTNKQGPEQKVVTQNVQSEPQADELSAQNVETEQHKETEQKNSLSSSASTPSKPAKAASSTQKGKASKVNLQHDRSDFLKGQFYVTAGSSIGIAFRTFTVSDNYQEFIHKNFSGLKETSEKERFAYSYNLGLEYYITPSLAFQTGFNYSVLGEHANYDFDVESKAIVDPNTGIITSYQVLQNVQTVNFNSNNSYKYLKVPLVLSFRIVSNQYTAFHLNAGVNFTSLRNVQGSAIDTKTLEQKPLVMSDFNKSGLDYNVGFGLSYALNSSTGLYFDTYYHKAMKNVMADDHVIVKPWAVGFNLSLSKSFK